MIPARSHDLDPTSGAPIHEADHLDAPGGAGSGFERRVWAALLEIPCGRTESYSALARRIGRPGAARAVGAANRRNPLGIVVPCHREIPPRTRRVVLLLLDHPPEHGRAGPRRGAPRGVPMVPPRDTMPPWPLAVGTAGRWTPCLLGPRRRTFDGRTWRGCCGLWGPSWRNARARAWRWYGIGESMSCTSPTRARSQSGAVFAPCGRSWSPAV